MPLNERALWTWSYGLYIVTARAGGRANGQIANSVFQVTAVPPRVAVAVNHENFTHDLIRESGYFGVSVLAALLGRPQVGHEHLYWEFHEGGFHQAVRMGDWKAVRRAGGETEVYDLGKDVGEAKNLAAARPDLVAKAEALFRTARTDSPQFPVRAPVR